MYFKFHFKMKCRLGQSSGIIIFIYLAIFKAILVAQAKFLQ